MIAAATLNISPNQKIAYHRMPAKGDGANLPGIVFLGGFRSDMTGLKAEYVQEWANARGRACLRFDYRGHGASSGKFEELGIGDWCADARTALQELTEGPQILIGSSMGGWIALLLAREMPERVAGIIGLAAAPDFTEDGMWARFSSEQRLALQDAGRIELPSEYSDDPYPITRHLIEDGRQNLVLRAPIPARFPVRLLHGTADPDVDMAVAVRLLEVLDGPDVRLTLLKGAGHRLSEPSDLALLGNTLLEVTEASGSGGAR
ncbi:MAG: alpha/beta hydrolase [Paracoccaceae bacterium]